jgi:DNA (cytosine-5)-methyltransferase 1
VRQRRAVDLFCSAGGATRGYQLAGFHVTGVDIDPQPNYCGDDFVQADAMTHPLDGFDLVHASPVCYLWSKMRQSRPGSSAGHPDLITPLRPILRAAGVPYVIENVPGAPLIDPVQVCGSGLGLRLQRHRLFESNVPLWGVPCAHGQNPWNPAYKHSTGPRGGTRRRVPVIGEWRIPAHLQHEAMGIDWMTLPELTEAIPPAYTEHVGSQILAAIVAAA